MIRLAHPEIPEEVADELLAILRSGFLTSGRCVARLEQEISRRLEGREVILVSSGTTAALVAFHALRDRGATHAVLPDFLFPSIASSALRVGLTVHLVDIDPVTLSTSVEQLESLNLPDSTVVVSVDQFGIPGPNDRLHALANERGWAWFEDAACALGSHCGMGPCGTRSTVSILSFHPRKTLTTCEGGAVVTADLDIAHRVRLLRNHGMDGQGLDRRFVHPGYNARLSEVHAAVGLAQIPHLDDYLERRQQCCRRYIRRLADIPDITIPDGFRQPGNSYQSFVVLLPPHRSRNAAIAALADKGIEATIPGFAIHEQPAFTGLTRQSASLSTSSALAAHGLALPIHERLSLEDVDRVADALCASLAH